jgi:hypothetical protein
MSGASKTCPLSSALLALLPGAGVRSRKATGWHSATFAGERVTVLLGLEGEQRHERAAHFAQALPETEFSLRRQLVADIVVSEISDSEDTLLLTVEALLLDE